jgi:hypothetical protein
MSQLDMMTISSVGAAGVAARSALQVFSRLGFGPRRTRRDRVAISDARAASFLRSLGLDPSDHLDISPAAAPSASAPQTVG